MSVAALVFSVQKLEVGLHVTSIKVGWSSASLQSRALSVG